MVLIEKHVEELKKLEANLTETEATEEDELLDLKTNIKEMVAHNDGLVGEVESTRGAGDGHHLEKTNRGSVGRNAFIVQLIVSCPIG